MDFDFIKMFLPPEANAAIGVANGEDPKTVLAQYGVSKLSSMPNSDATAATEQFKQAGLPSPGLEVNPEIAAPTTEISAPTLNEGYTPIDTMGRPDYGVAVNQDFPNDTNFATTQTSMYDNAINKPMDNFQGLPESGIAGQGEIAIEEPETFLGLEGKDYTKMGMQGVLAAGVSAAQPTPIQPSKAPVGPGMTKGSPIQAQAPGVNSMVQPDPRVNSMQMTQAQGLISPFQRDRYRRGQY
jgi:hypothetical protein